MHLRERLSGLLVRVPVLALLHALRQHPPSGWRLAAVLRSRSFRKAWWFLRTSDVVVCYPRPASRPAPLQRRHARVVVPVECARVGHSPEVFAAGR